MKKLVILFIILAATNYLYSTVSDSSNWKKGGAASLVFNQIAFSNWAKGGESSVSGTSALSFFANFKDSDIVWDNSADFAFGIMYSDQFETRKTEDKIDLSSQFGYRGFGDYYYSVLLSFKTQFAEGFNYPNDSVLVSKFMAPAYLVMSTGMDYKPNEGFSVYLSPVTGRIIFVEDQNLANNGSFSVDPAVKDSLGNIIKPGKKIRADFGAYLTLKYKKQIIENIGFKTNINLFNNYTDKDSGNRDNIDVNWESSLDMKVNDFITSNIFVHLIYDDNINVPLYDYQNGIKTKTGEGPRLQVKEILGIGLKYKF